MLERNLRVHRPGSRITLSGGVEAVVERIIIDRSGAVRYGCWWWDDGVRRDDVFHEDDIVTDARMELIGFDWKGEPR